MGRIFACAGVLYAGVGTFLFVVVFLRGNNSAYTTDQSWSEAFQLGLTWPWHVLQSLGIVG